MTDFRHGLLMVALGACIVAGCSRGRSSTPENAPSPANHKPGKKSESFSNTVETKVAINSKDGTGKTAGKKVFTDDFEGIWVSNAPQLKLNIRPGKTGYYVQINLSGDLSFYGNFLLQKGVLVCGKRHGNTEGELENEYMTNIRIRATEDRKALEFTCDACEPATLERME